MKKPGTPEGPGLRVSRWTVSRLMQFYLGCENAVNYYFSMGIGALPGFSTVVGRPLLKMILIFPVYR